LVVVGVIIYLINHNWKSFRTPGFDSTVLAYTIGKARA
jgi:hypothetical protein